MQCCYLNRNRVTHSRGIYRFQWINLIGHEFGTSTVGATMISLNTTRYVSRLMFFIAPHVPCFCLFVLIYKQVGIVSRRPDLDYHQHTIEFYIVSLYLFALFRGAAVSAICIFYCIHDSLLLLHSAKHS